MLTPSAHIAARYFPKAVIPAVTAGRSCATLSAAVLAALLIPAPQAHAGQGGPHGTAYSIHMQATIPTRCTIRNIARYVTLERVSDSTAPNKLVAGHAGFQLICNVPYALSLYPDVERPRRGRLIPLSAQDTKESPLTMPDPPTDVAPVADDEAQSSIKTHCLLTPAKAAEQICPSDDSESALLPVRPLTTGQISFEQTDLTTSNEAEISRPTTHIAFSISGRF